MAGKATVHLTILHTNDLHGRVPQLMRIATLVRQIRSEVKAAGGYCIYVDAGDSEDTTLLESSLTKGSAMNAILRGAGCEFAALGNAIPVRYGPQAIAGMAEHFGRPLLCANLLDQNDELVAGLEPFAMESFGVLKLGILGATDPVKSYETFFHLRPKKPDELLPALIEQARRRGAQTILLLSHLGLRDDKRMAENVPGIDIIIGGHSHEALNPPLQVNGMIIAQAGDFGKFLGRLDLEIDSGSGKATHFEGTLLPIDESIPPDAEAQSAVEAESIRVHKMMNRVVGVLNVLLDLADDRECAAGNLLADSLLERIKGTEIAIVLAGHWEAGLEEGPLTQGALYSASRSTANPAKLELTGEQIEQFLCAALKPENAARTPHALRGRKVGLPHVAGMTVCYDPSNLDRLEIRVGDASLQKDRKYLVASTDMEFSEWVGYLVRPDDQVKYEVPTIMPEVLEDYIVSHSPVEIILMGRIRPMFNTSPSTPPPAAQ